MFRTASLRVVLFVITNLAVVVLLGIVLQVLGVDRMLAESGLPLNLAALLVFAALFGFGGSFVSLALSKWLAKVSTRAQVIDHPRDANEAWLLETVARQAQAAGIGMPQVAIFPSGEPNAFATGMSRNNALVAVSVGLLETLRRDEIEAVLAHEVSHVANGDMVTMALLQGVLNTFVIFLSRIIGLVVDKAVFRTERGVGLGYWIVTILAQIGLGILASIVVMWFSRRREFRADAGAAQLASPHKMVSALQALQRHQHPGQLPKDLAAFGIRGGGGWTALFHSHPPLDARIAALSRRG